MIKLSFAIGAVEELTSFNDRVAQRSFDNEVKVIAHQTRNALHLPVAFSRKLRPRFSARERSWSSPREMISSRRSTTAVHLLDGTCPQSAVGGACLRF